MSDLDLTNWPRDKANGRLLCTPEQPRPKGAPGAWSHTSVESIGDESDFSTGTEYDHYRCRDCGTTWVQEVPQ